MVFAEFEEKQHETAFNIELGASGPVFASGQVFGEVHGIRLFGLTKRYRALPARMGVVDPDPVQGVEVPGPNARGSTN